MGIGCVEVQNALTLKVRPRKTGAAFLLLLLGCGGKTLGVLNSDCNDTSDCKPPLHCLTLTCIPKRFCTIECASADCFALPNDLGGPADCRESVCAGIAPYCWR